MDRIGSELRTTQTEILEVALNPLRKYITGPGILTHCQAAGHSWRDCLWNPTLTVLACIWKQLQATASARQVEDWVASLAPERAWTERDGTDFCAARKRLPERVFHELVEQVGRAAADRAAKLFQGHPVWLVDGSTLRTPNTLANEKVFGRSRNQTRESRSPLLRLVVLVCAGCGAVLSTACAPYAVSEWEVFLQLLPTLPAGGLLVADRHYSTFLMLALTQQRESHVLTRYNERRRGRRLKRHARGDELFEWKKPRPEHVSRPDLLWACPDLLTVRLVTRPIARRGYRTWELRIATTLLDPSRYPAEALLDLYLERWNIELDLRTLKTHYGMARLTGKTPEILRKEIYAIMLAYNGVLAVMSENGPSVRSLSHTRARKLLLIFAERMTAAPAQQLPQMYRQLLKLMAEAKLLEQERLPQPRAIVQRPSTYPVLMTSRNAWRRAYLAA